MFEYKLASATMQDSAPLTIAECYHVPVSTCDFVYSTVYFDYVL